MAILGQVGIRIVGDTRGLIAAFSEAKGSTRSFAATLETVGPALSRVSKDLLLIGGAITTTFALMVKSAASVEDAIIRATAVTPGLVKGTKDFEAIARMTKDTSNLLGTSQESLAKIWKDLGQAGFSAGAQMQIFNDIAKFNFSLMEEGQDATLPLIDIMKAYGIKISGTKELLDKLTVAGEKSSGSQGELLEALSVSAVTAGALKVPFNDFLTTLVALSNQAIRGSTAGMAYRRLLLNLYAPSSEAAEVLNSLGLATYKDTEVTKGLRTEMARLQEELTYTNTNTEEGKNRAESLEKQITSLAFKIRNYSGEARSVSEILSDLTNKFKGMSDAQKAQILDTLGGVRGFGALSAILKELDGTFVSFSGSLNKSGGALEDLTKIKMQSAKYHLDKLRESFRNLSADLGTQLLPVVVKGTDIFGNLLNSLEGISPSLKKVMVIGTASVGMYAGIAGILGMLAPHIVNTTKFLYELAGAFLKVTLAANPIAVITGTLVAGISVLEKSYNKLFDSQVEGHKIMLQASGDEMMFKKFAEIRQRWAQVSVKAIQEVGYAEGEEAKLLKDIEWVQKRLNAEKSLGEAQDKRSVETLEKMLAYLTNEKKKIDEATKSVQGYSGSLASATKNLEALQEASRKEMEALPGTQEEVGKTQESWENLNKSQRDWLVKTAGGMKDAQTATEAYKEHGASMIETMSQYGVPAEKMLETGRTIKRLGGVERWAGIYAPKTKELVEAKKREEETKAIEKLKEVYKGAEFISPLPEAEARKVCEAGGVVPYKPLTPEEKKARGEALEEEIGRMPGVAIGPVAGMLPPSPLPKEMSEKANQFMMSISEIAQSTRRVGEVIMATFEDGRTLMIDIKRSHEELQRDLEKYRKDLNKLAGGGEAKVTGKALGGLK